MKPISSRARLRTIWISDVHLGTRGCKAGHLLAFLRSYDCDTLYLVGDIIDIWRMKKAWYWPQSHNDVILEVLRKAKRGTNVVYIPGNHDEGAREYCAMQFANIRIAREDVHLTMDGRKLWVIHGDEFDGVVKYAKWLAYLGDTAYQFALFLNHWFNEARRHLGYPYWSLSAYLKSKVKDAVKYIDSFEHALADEAGRRKLDGVVCGHIHRAEIREIGEVLYCNSGDWVESCTALAEDFHGCLHIIHWAAEQAARDARPSAFAEAG